MEPVRSPVAGALRAVPLFAALSDEELEFLAVRTILRKKSVGAALFTEGEPCAGLYIVGSGKVQVFKTSPGGREQVLAIQGPGSSIAELPMFDEAVTHVRLSRWKLPNCCSYPGHISAPRVSNTRESRSRFFR